MSIRACTVEQFFLKPNWFSYKALWVSKKPYNFLCIIFSIILSKIGNKEMGLKLFRSWVDPPLWRGKTLAILSNSGNSPVENELFMIPHKGTEMMSATGFSILRGILLGPVPLLGKAWIISSTSLGEISSIVKLVSIRFLRNFPGEVWFTVGTFLSRSGPTLAKKLLTQLAISFGLSINLPFTLSCDIPWSLRLLVLTIALIPCQVFLILILCSSK